jgi:hypothetical protein
VLLLAVRQRDTNTNDVCHCGGCLIKQWDSLPLYIFSLYVGVYR